MHQRGVSRPMPLMHEQHGGGGHEMTGEMRARMLRTHHQQTLWVYWTLIVLGIWLAIAPFTFGYLNADLWCDPSGGRGVWFSDQTHTALRAQLMTWSDVIAGVHAPAGRDRSAIVVLGMRQVAVDEFGDG
jgi:hypothetical protein